MADSKVSELTAATSAGGSDVLYLVQSNTSKKITVANLFGNVSNISLSGNITIADTPQSLSSPGVISITTPITHLTVGGTDGQLQLPPGNSGQTKILVMIGASGGTYYINTNNVANNANVTFNNVGDTATMLYTNSKWYVIGGTANVDY